MFHVHSDVRRTVRVIVNFYRIQRHKMRVRFEQCGLNQTFGRPAPQQPLTATLFMLKCRVFFQLVTVQKPFRFLLQILCRLDKPMNHFGFRLKVERFRQCCLDIQPLTFDIQPIVTFPGSCTVRYPNIFTYTAPLSSTTAQSNALPSSIAVTRAYNFLSFASHN